MDGVRRPKQGGEVLILESGSPSGAAAAMVLPQTLAMQAANSIDGLRRAAETIWPLNLADSETDPYNPVLAANAERTVWPYALASLAALPMFAVASVYGIRSVLANRSVTQPRAASTTATAPADPVPQTEQSQLAATAVTASSLQQLMDNFGQSGTYSLYVKDLNTGQLGVVGPDRSFRSASLYKLFVASEIYRRIDNGTLSYTSVAGSGTGNNVAGCLNLMITISDNGCGNALGSLVGWNNLTQTLRAQGFGGTSLNQPMVTTPRDVGTLFERLYAGTLLSPDSSANFLALLKAQKVNNRLPQGLPASTTFAHKTGDLDGFLHDSGIVYGPKTNYLVVMMGAPGARPSDFATLSQRLWQHFNQ